jgi:hypothetical protein
MSLLFLDRELPGEPRVGRVRRAQVMAPGINPSLSFAPNFNFTCGFESTESATYEFHSITFFGSDTAFPDHSFSFSPFTSACSKTARIVTS